MKKFTTIFLSAILAISLVGCGAGGKDTTTTGETSEETTGTNVTTEASGENKEYVIATDTSFEPFVVPDVKDASVVSGIDMEIMNAIAKDQGFTVTYNPIGFKSALGAVSAGQADAIMAGCSINDERKETFDFTEAYFETTVTMGVSANSDIKSLEDLKGKKVAIKTGTSGAEFAKEVMDKYGFTITEFATSPVMYQDVIIGNSAACFEDYPVIKYNIQQGAKMTVIEDIKEKPTQYGVGVKKGKNPEFIELFNKGLANIKADGTYQKIVDSYIK